MWRIYFCLVLLFTSMLAQADITPAQLPDTLKPWVNWVLQDTTDYHCRYFYNREQKQCAWAGPLNLNISAKQGDFSGEWTLDEAGWLELPGDNQHWPQQVQLNQQPAAVVRHQNKPAIWLAAGHYSVSGMFFWDNRPENLSLPEAQGLLKLSIDGQAVVAPNRKHGMVWLREGERPKTANQENRLDVQVFRHITDDVPLLLRTRLELEVSGTPREIKLPYALLNGFIPVALSSALPARLDSDGSLQLQVRPGRWMIELTGRSPQPLSKLELAIHDEAWPADEIWVFQAVPAQRLVEIENLAAIDPSQTNLPDDWRNLPAYQIKQGGNMQFKTIRRGDPEPESNQLNLNRELWLDFDGGGYTVQDQINGQMTSGWRLDVQPEMQLGQVKLDGQNQLITQHPKTGQPGVELRKGALQLSADSRMTGAIDAFSAVGWQETVQQLNMQIHLPPGWRLLAASGVDNDPHSWLAQWTLLDFFLVLIATVAVAHLWQPLWGGVALLGLLLLWHEPDAPRWIWLNLLAAIGLLRLLPEMPVKRWITAYRNLCWLAFVLIALPFAVAQIRCAIYPQLELHQMAAPEPQPLAVSAPASNEAQIAEEVYDTARSAAKSMRKSLNKTDGAAYPAAAPPIDQRIDPNANLQTGPGLPEWQWRSFQLSWNGAVDADAQVSLWYLSPALTRALNLCRVLLLIVLALQLADKLHALRTWPWRYGNWLKFMLLLPLLAGAPQNSEADLPDAALLEQLKSRLLQAPKCLPDCAQIAQLTLNTQPNSMQLTLEIHAQQATAIPLPALDGQWFPQKISVDGDEHKALSVLQNNQLWLSVEPGVHQVQMSGQHLAADKLTLPLPLVPQYTRVISDGWQVEGVRDDGKAVGQLELNRINKQPTTQLQQGLQQNALPPFVRVERIFNLGLDWHVTTLITAQSSSDAAVVLEYPLLPGEAITSAYVKSKDGKAQIYMSGRQQSFSFTSVLDKREQLSLTAANTPQWTEVWRIDPSTLWHLESDGIAVVHHQSNQGQWLPEWRPWAGETVRLFISKPQPVQGATLTIDRSELTVQPGKRLEKSELALTLRSSKAGQHTLTLPENSDLQTVTIDGIPQPIRQKERQVTLPLHPGSQTVNLSWQQSKEQSGWLETPQVNLGVASVNHSLHLTLGADRWVLLLFGSQLGPAVLFWGVLPVLMLLAWGLNKIQLTPLSAAQWFLLLLGLSQLELAAAMLVVLWLLALGLRAQRQPADGRWFNALQIGLVLWTGLALLLLFLAVQQGLLGLPDMQITGNNSTAYQLNWYQDRNGDILPTATVIALPLMAYRLLMLAWALWMAMALLRWLRWGWGCFSVQGLWRKSAD